MDQVNNVNQFFQCLIVFGLFGGIWGGLMFIQSVLFNKPDAYKIKFDEQRTKYDKEFTQFVRSKAIDELNSSYTPVTNDHILHFDAEMCQIIHDDRIHGMYGG